MITPALFWASAGAHLSPFSRREWHALRALRERYRQDHDLFSEREAAHLCFVRWLYCTGRLVP